MSIPSIASKCASQPRPVGQMIETTYPASRSVVASCHTRRSNGDGRFSTSMRTRLDFCFGLCFGLCGGKDGLRTGLQVTPLDMQGDEAAGTARIAAYPERRRLAGERLPVHRFEAVPGVLVARAVAPAIAGVAVRPHIESTHHLIAAIRKGSSSRRASRYGTRKPFT